MQSLFLLGLSPKLKIECNKWKNHFSEMKEDVGVSPHEKKGTIGCLHKDRKSFNPIPTSLFLYIINLAIVNYICVFVVDKIKKDVGMGLNDFLSLCRNFLVPFLFS